MFCKKVNFDLKYHFVLCTGYRHPILKNNIKVRCQEIITNLMENNFDCNIIEMNIQPDHIHIMFETTPSIQLSKMVCSIKTVTSRLLKKEFKKELSKYYWTSKLWNSSYFILQSVNGLKNLLKIILDFNNFSIIGEFISTQLLKTIGWSFLRFFLIKKI